MIISSLSNGSRDRRPTNSCAGLSLYTGSCRAECFGFWYCHLVHAIEKMDTYIDVSIDDLNGIYTRATSLAHKRSLENSDLP